MSAAATHFTELGEDARLRKLHAGAGVEKRYRENNNYKRNLKDRLSTSSNSVKSGENDKLSIYE